MTTQARILANRLNAQRSTGPKTTQGKALVSQNALKHGLSARHDVITSESQADFDLHREALLAELAPQDPMESMLAERIVSLSWRLKRADLIQNQTFDAIHEKITNNPLANLAKSFALKGLGLPQPEPTDSNPDLILGRIALKDFSNARVLDRLLMYERRIEHSLYKTTLELQRLHLLRDVRAIPHSRPHPPNDRPAPNPNVRATPCDRPNPRTRTGDPTWSPYPLYYAKQTQFPKPQNQRNSCNRKDLQEKTTPTTLKKTNPIKPNPAIRHRGPLRSNTQYAIRNTKYKPGPSRRSLWRSRIKDSSRSRDPAGIP